MRLQQRVCDKLCARVYATRVTAMASSSELMALMAFSRRYRIKLRGPTGLYPSWRIMVASSVVGNRSTTFSSSKSSATSCQSTRERPMALSTPGLVSSCRRSRDRKRCCSASCIMLSCVTSVCTRSCARVCVVGDSTTREWCGQVCVVGWVCLHSPVEIERCGA